MESIKVLSETRAFDSYFKVDKALVSHDKGDGTSETYSRYKLTRPDAVAVLILNKDTEKITLVRLFLELNFWNIIQIPIITFNPQVDDCSHLCKEYYQNWIENH